MKQRTRRKLIGSIPKITSKWLTHGAIQKNKKKKSSVDIMKITDSCLADRIRAVSELVKEADNVA